jgi:hypothetical protein
MNLGGVNIIRLKHLLLMNEYKTPNFHYKLSNRYLC